MSIIGLGFILIAWLYQLYYMFKNSNAIKPFFLVVYVVGLIFLIYEQLAVRAYDGALLNALIIIPVAIIFWKIWKIRKENVS